MRILITGGFGYLGGRLAQFLANQAGYTVLLGSRQQTRPPDWLSHVEVIQTRWDSPASLEQICIGVNAAVHLAGMNAQDCTADPAAALEVNGLATARLLNAAIKQRVKRFIYLSTAHIYGNPLAGVITEETCPTNLHPYATSHRAGEDVVRAAHQRGEIEGIVIRLSNGYGTPTHKDANCWMLLINDLCRQAVITQEMVLRSTGLQRRDFVPLTDACRAIGHLLALPRQDLGRGIFNVGGKTASTVWEVACLIQKRCETTLGFLPQLNRVAPQADEAIVELDYRLDALLQTGFRPDADRVKEIDQLIKFCRASFC
jgi:UDP-glucose 4-epimerase